MQVLMKTLESGNMLCMGKRNEGQSSCNSVSFNILNVTYPIPPKYL